MQNQNNKHSTKIHVKINKQSISLAYIFALLFNMYMYVKFKKAMDDFQ